jgi:hypothetical protein
MLYNTFKPFIFNDYCIFNRNISGYDEKVLLNKFVLSVHYKKNQKEIGESV